MAHQISETLFARFQGVFIPTRPASGDSQSGVALRLPPQSKTPGISSSCAGTTSQPRPGSGPAAPGNGGEPAKTLPQGLLGQLPGQAIDYALKRWEALTQFAADGTLEIDNDPIENAIRPSALGKENWLFVGHPEAGERNALICTLPGSCRRHGINPFEYLEDMFTRLPATKITEIKQFTPAALAKAKAKEQVAAQAA